MLQRRIIRVEDFAEEPSVGDVSYFGFGGDVGGREADGVSDYSIGIGCILAAAAALLEFPGNAIGERNRRNSPRLRAYYLAIISSGGSTIPIIVAGIIIVVGPSIFVKVLRQLSGFAAAGFANEN